jgi:hypothetical protein
VYFVISHEISRILRSYLCNGSITIEFITSNCFSRLFVGYFRRFSSLQKNVESVYVTVLKNKIKPDGVSTNSVN